MNLSLAELPDRTEVLVVGAGPAGSAAALTLARGGAAVTLVDQHVFPRDKTCGDALIADAQAALARLGLHDAVMAQAHVLPAMGFIGPRGGCLQLDAPLAVLPRRVLDDLLCQAAARAGARMHAPVRFERPLRDGQGRVVGALLAQGDGRHELRSDTVILATGAMPQALLAAGLCRRRAPSGVALRAYLRHAEMAQRQRRIEVLWHPRLRHGYGWVFPGPDGVFNVGVGVFHEHGEGTRGKVNLHERFEALREIHPGVRELLQHGHWVGDPKGAPLRCTLQGAEHAQPGILVAGEAAGSTYLLTGEGIGKALETGMLAADAVLAQRQGRAARPLHEDYAQRLAALAPRFQIYAQANPVNNHPWLADLVIWRARRSARLRERIGRVLDESGRPGNLLSWKGALRLLRG